MTPLEVTYFSDVLCIWAYVAQERVEATKRTFGEDVRVRYRLCSVFGDARNNIGTAWRDCDGFAGYSRHVIGVADKFPHVRVHPEIWRVARPASSASPHLFLSAVLEWESGQDDRRSWAGASKFESVMWALRRWCLLSDGRYATA